MLKKQNKRVIAFLYHRTLEVLFLFIFFCIIKVNYLLGVINCATREKIEYYDNLNKSIKS